MPHTEEPNHFVIAGESILASDFDLAQAILQLTRATISLLGLLLIVSSMSRRVSRASRGRCVESLKNKASASARMSAIGGRVSATGTMPDPAGAAGDFGRQRKAYRGYHNHLLSLSSE